MLTDDDENLSFLKERIEEINFALFKAEINSVLTLPNNIISTLKIDNDGYVWFYTYCNQNYAPLIDKQFFACLEYYQKSKNSRIRINGQACIAENDDAFTDVLSNNNEAGNNVLLVKLKILHAEFFEDAVKSNWLSRIKNTVTEFLFSSNEKTFDFS